jgi:hypothetical protein|tara:strand:+ start:3563 stop:3775 length:213 start_codon:yes stop_codon:yes gene_type:complete
MTAISHTGKVMENAVITTQPLVYGVAAGTFLGLQLNEWIMMGTGVLLIMNIGLASARIYQGLKEKKNDSD